MTGRLSAANARDVIRALQRAGFVVDRVSGSHYILGLPHDPSRAVTVPFHVAKSLKPGTLRNIVRQAGSFAANVVRLLLHALAYNLGNFMRTLAMPETA